MPSTRSVVVIGSGFSGVMTAVHLLSNPDSKGLRVVLLNRTGVMARGVAYGTNSPSHLLNVPAGRMSAYPDDPEHFLRFLRRHDASAATGTFACRSAYGEYLAANLAWAEEVGLGMLERVVAEASSIERLTGACAQVKTTDGRAITADRIVLAVGNYPPSHLPELPPGFLRSANYIRDPWAAGVWTSVPHDRPVLLLGTGLTMLDAALELHARGIPGTVALSRRGLLPRGHDTAIPPSAPEHRPAGITEGPASLRVYLRAIRAKIRRIALDGGNWRQVIDSIRPVTPQLWQALSNHDRERFFRHLRPYWDVHRHRAAPQTAAAVNELIRTRWLTVKAGRVTEVETGAEGVRVAIACRRFGISENLTVGTVVNCTGPAGNLSGIEDRLLDDLFACGMARPDPLGLGIDVGPNGRMIGADGQESNVLWYVGPFLRARDGEGTAVPELRIHAARAAAAVLQSLAAGPEKQRRSAA